MRSQLAVVKIILLLSIGLTGGCIVKDVESLPANQSPPPLGVEVALDSGAVRGHVRQATAALADVDQNKALEVVNMKAEINGLINESLQYQADRVAPTTPDLIATFRMEDEVIDALRRIYRLSKRLAKLMLPAVVSSKES